MFNTAVDLSCEDEGVPEDCTSTAGQIEACFKANVDQSTSVFDDVPNCDALTEATELPDVEEDLELPAACDTVLDNCPEVLD